MPAWLLRVVLLLTCPICLPGSLGSPGGHVAVGLELVDGRVRRLVGRHAVGGGDVIRGALSGQLLGGGGGESAVDGKGDGVVEASQEEAVCRNLGSDVHADSPVSVILHHAQGLEGRGTGAAQVIDEELEVEVGGVGRP